MKSLNLPRGHSLLVVVTEDALAARRPGTFGIGKLGEITLPSYTPLQDTKVRMLFCVTAANPEDAVLSPHEPAESRVRSTLQDIWHEVRPHALKQLGLPSSEPLVLQIPGDLEPRHLAQHLRTIINA